MGNGKVYDSKPKDDERNDDNHQKTSNGVTDSVPATTGAGPGCSSPTSVVDDEQALVDAQLEMDATSTPNGAKDKTKNNPTTASPHRYSRHPRRPAKSQILLPGSNVPSSSQIPHRGARGKMKSTNELNLLDQHNRIMAAILTRFRNIINAATEPLSKTATIPQASLNLMTLNNETSAMVCTTSFFYQHVYIFSREKLLALLFANLSRHNHDSSPCSLTYSLHSATFNILHTHAQAPHQTRNLPSYKTNAHFSAHKIKEVENLLALSREIKMLWIAGPLQKPGDAGEKNREKMLDEKAHEVSRLWEELERLIIEKENGMRAYPTPAATATTTAMGSNSSQQAPTTTAGGGNVKVEADDDQTLVGSVSA